MVKFVRDIVEVIIGCEILVKKKKCLKVGEIYGGRYMYYFYNIIFGKIGIYFMFNLIFYFFGFFSCDKYWMFIKVCYYFIIFEIYLICVI